MREVAEETGLAGRLEQKLGDVRYVYTWDGERVFKVVSFFLLRWRSGRIGELPAGMELEVAEARWLPLDDAPRAARLRRRARDGEEGDRGADCRRRLYDASRAVADVRAQLLLARSSPTSCAPAARRRRSASATSPAKYKKGMIVTVLVGVRYGQREKIFDAVIDKVEVKQLSELSPREIEHDNPEIRRPDEMSRFLGQLYNREVSEDETVTVIRFSQIIGSMF